MLHRWKAATDARIDSAAYTGQLRRAHRRQHVLHVVRARSGISATGSTGSALPPSFASQKTLSPCTNAPCLIRRAALNQKICASPVLRTWRNHLRSLVLRIQHQKVVRVLLLGDLRLRRRIAIKGLMPIQVVRRDVQHHRDLRLKLARRLQLKARNLQHIPASAVLSAIKFDHRQSDVPAHQRLALRIFEDLADQRRRRRLPVRSCDRAHLARQETGSPAPARRSPASQAPAPAPPPAFPAARPARPRSGPAAETSAARARRFDHDAGLEQRRNLAASASRTACIRTVTRAPRPSKTSRRHARLAQPNHQHPFVLQFHTYHLTQNFRSFLRHQERLFGACATISITPPAFVTKLP